jgi:hypothetical protein
LSLEGDNLDALVFGTSRPVRRDRYGDSSPGSLGAEVRAAGIRSAVGTPIIVEGRLWGGIFVGLSLERPLPPDTEARLASFTELVAAAVANAAKHARASAVQVELGADDMMARLTVRDDGTGGADPGRGSGLTGLGDRIEALGGTLRITSPPGGGTTLLIQIPAARPALRDAAEDPADSRCRQLRLRQEPGGRAFGDQIGIVCFGSGGNQDHVGALAVAGQEPGQGKAALAPEPDVDEDEVRPQRAGLPERLGNVRCHAHDRQALSLEEKARRLEEGIVVVN